MSYSHLLRVLILGSLFITGLSADEAPLEEEAQESEEPSLFSDEAAIYSYEETYGNYYEMSEDGSKMTMTNRNGKLKVSVEEKNTDFISQCEYEREQYRKKKEKSSEKLEKRHRYFDAKDDEKDKSSERALEKLENWHRSVNDKDEGKEESKAPGVLFHAEWTWK